MPLSPGDRLGPFEVVAPIGAGAMGEVWRARDPRIGRDVAIKVLPEAFARDPERLQRFEVEARAAGALNHPNILTVFEVGAHEGAPYVVMELLEGSTLRGVIAQGALPWRRAGELATQIARGLAAAHERGVLHRDLKPENLFVTRDGRVKILDFGLAKLTQLEAAAKDSGDSLTNTLTQTGQLLGTAGYMAPEQARGLAADARSDLFALGVILHEMLTGKRAFQGASAIETIAAVLQAEPGPLPDSTPVSIQRVVSHLLEKQPEQRFQNARDVAFALESLADPSTQSIAPGELAAARAAKPAAARGAAPLPLVGAALLGAVLLFGVLRVLPHEPASADLPHVTEIGSSDLDSAPDFSPDGKLLAFESHRDGHARAWVRQLSSGSERAFGADTGFAPRFTPDGLELVYGVQSGAGIALHRAAVIGGEDRVIVPRATSGVLSPDGKWLLYATTADHNDARLRLVLREMSTGADRTLRIMPANNTYNFAWSPDSKRLGTVSNVDLQIGTGISLVILTPKGEVVDSITAPGKGFIGSVSWTRDPQTVVVGVIERRLSVLVGESYLALYHIGDKILHPILRWPHPIMATSVGGDGEVAFDTQTNRSHLVRIPFGGGAPVTLTNGNAADRQPYFSHDGRYLIYASNRTGPSSIWRLELASGAIDRLTQCDQEDWDPSYTSDDSHVLFSSSRGGNYEIWMADADGSNPRQISHDGNDAENPTLTRDGKWVIYSSGSAARGGLWRVHPDGTGAEVVVKSAAIIPDLSPDSRYAAFINDRNELNVVRLTDGVVLPFRMTGLAVRAKLLQVGRARWAPDGRSLYVLCQTRDSRLAVFQQPFDESTGLVTPGKPLFVSPPDSEIESLAIAPDGKSIVISYTSSTSHLYVATGVPGVKGVARTAK